MAEKLVVGTVTSGGYGYRFQKNLAYAFVELAFAPVGTAIKIDILGEMIDATVVDPALYDPKMTLVRG